MIVVAAPIVSPSSYLFVAELLLSEYHRSFSLSLCTRQSPALCFIFLLMAKEWEMTNFTVGMGMASSPAAAPFTAASASPVTTCLYGAIPPIVDELLDLSSSHHDDCFPSAEGAAPPGGLASFSEFKPLQAPNSSFDLYIPQCEDAAELEWLSKFVDDSFSDVPCYNSGLGAVTAAAAAAVKREPLPRSRAERASSVSAAWSSLVAGTAQNASPSSPSSSSSSEFPEKVGSAGDARKGGGKGKKGGCGEGSAGGLRRCSHCASEKTPQWRTGPLGPKTLCNACGVRYKSGRLVQEYRPAASPTFVLSQHSNSHRKVMELRRQKEMLLFGHRTQQEGDASSCSAISELIHGGYSIS